VVAEAGHPQTLNATQTLEYTPNLNPYARKPKPQNRDPSPNPKPEPQTPSPNPNLQTSSLKLQTPSPKPKAQAPNPNLQNPNPKSQTPDPKSQPRGVQVMAAEGALMPYRIHFIGRPYKIHFVVTSPPVEIGILMPDNQRQHRTSHAPKDVLSLRICANYCAPCQPFLPPGTDLQTAPINSEPSAGGVRVTAGGGALLPNRARPTMPG